MPWFHKKKQPPAPKAPTPLTIRVDDIVSYDGAYWMVEQKLTYRQGGYMWYDYRIVDQDKTLWLSAEDDDGLELAVYRPLDAIEIPDPVPKRWDLQGHAFTLDEAGACEVTDEGQNRPPRVVQVQYWDFTAPDGALLSVEDWQGDREVSLGQAIETFEVDILPRKRHDGD